MPALRTGLGRGWERLTSAYPFSPLRETGVFAAVCALLTAIYLADYPSRGGFIADDWGSAAHTRFSGGLFDEIQALWPVSAKRPLLAVYNPVVYRVFGEHPARHHVWALFLSVLAVTCFFLLLRRLRVPPLWAGLTALLAFWFPAADSLRLWIAVGYGNLSLAACFSGLLLGIAGLSRPPGRSRILLSVGSCLLFAVSLGLYEVTAGAIAASGIFYLLAGVPWRLAWRKWLVDLVLTGFMVAAFTLGGLVPHQAGVNKPHGGQYISDRLKPFRDQAIELARQMTPLISWYTPLLIAVLALLIGLGAGVLLGKRLPEPGVTRALVMTVAGLGVIVAAYAIFVPADAFYFPATIDIGNRNNALAAYGYVLVLAGAALLAVELLQSAWPKSRPIASVAAALLLGAAVLSYAGRVDTESKRYEQSYAIQGQVLRTIGADYRPVNGDVLFGFGYLAATHPDLPVFVHDYDLGSALQLRYRNASIGGIPVRDLSILSCTPAGVNYGGVVAPYGNAVFANVASSVVLRVRSAASCRQALASKHFDALYNPS